MFENIMNFFKKAGKKDQQALNSKDAAKERLHLVLMQDRANVSADFLDLMKQEIIDVIKKYIEVDENAIDVRLTNKENEDGTNGAPALYANIPIINIKDETKKGNKINTTENNNQIEENIEIDNNNENEDQNVEKILNQEEQDIEENGQEDIQDNSSKDIQYEDSEDIQEDSEEEIEKVV